MIKRRISKILSVSIILFIFFSYLWLGRQVIFSNEDSENISDEIKTETTSGTIIKQQKPEYVRGIHVTQWVASSKKRRGELYKLFEDTELNTIVIDIKECEGEVHIPGVKLAQEYGTNGEFIPDIRKYLEDLKDNGIYTIARIVVFCDNNLPRKRPELAIKNIDGEVWENNRKLAWLDPYNEENWNYVISIAEKASDIGFQEIQFDYIRFPSDGDIKNCRYSKIHTSTGAPQTIESFLQQAHRKLKPLGVNISIDVFGLTATVYHDMGIGQKIVNMSKWVDYISPMVYPSHYAKGEYNIPDPVRDPYMVVFYSMYGAKKRLKDASDKLRPFLQDFSIGGYNYSAREVLAQIQAVYDNDIGDWLLWNPRCVYTNTAIKDKKYADSYDKSNRYVALNLIDRFNSLSKGMANQQFEYKFVGEERHIYPAYPEKETSSVKVTIIDESSNKDAQDYEIKTSTQSALIDYDTVESTSNIKVLIDDKDNNGKSDVKLNDSLETQTTSVNMIP